MYKEQAVTEPSCAHHACKVKNYHEGTDMMARADEARQSHAHGPALSLA